MTHLRYLVLFYQLRTLHFDLRLAHHASRVQQAFPAARSMALWQDFLNLRRRSCILLVWLCGSLGLMEVIAPRHDQSLKQVAKLTIHAFLEVSSSSNHLLALQSRDAGSIADLLRKQSSRSLDDIVTSSRWSSTQELLVLNLDDVMILVV